MRQLGDPIPAGRAPPTAPQAQAQETAGAAALRGP